MTYEEVLRHYGTQSRIGEVLGIKQSAVSSWAGVIPQHYQYQLEIVTDGFFRADEDLRHPGYRASKKAPHTPRAA